MGARIVMRIDAFAVLQELHGIFQNSGAPDMDPKCKDPQQKNKRPSFGKLP